MQQRPESRVYQVRDHQNELDALLRDGQLTLQGASLVQQVEAIIARRYARAAVVCHQPMAAHMRHLRIAIEPFYSERETPAVRGCDCLIVAGTPMLPLNLLERQARMIYFERDVPFNTTWSTRQIAYPGHPHTCAVGGFWHDRDLHAVLRQYREAEIVRAAYRANPLTNPVDIWLLTNIPVDLPVTDLIVVNDVLGVAAGPR